MCKSKWFCAAVAGVLSLGAGQAAHADLSGFVGMVGFDKEAKLGGSPGLGLRWGKSSRIIGGETSLMVAFPERKLSNGGPAFAGISTADTAKGTATAIFYEGRLLVNIPLGVITPFANVGWGAILTTSTDPPKQIPMVPTQIGGIALTGEQLQQAQEANEKIQTANQALKLASKLQHNQAFSYGVGARKSLNSRLDLRVDLRQYAVFSVKGIVTQKLQEQAAGQVQGLTGIALPVEKKKTVRYEELSLGVSFRF